MRPQWMGGPAASSVPPNGFSRYCVGATIGGSGLGANVAYWGK